MMREAPEAFDVGRESQAVLDAYGVVPDNRTSFAWQCLVARRLVERGVRVVELIDTGSHDNWDAHGDMQQHRPKAQRVDRPLAALIEDLKRAGCWNQHCWSAAPSSVAPLGPQRRGTRGATITPRPSVAFWPAPASAAARLMEKRTNTERRSPRIRYTFTTITPRSCTCWGWITRASHIATPAAIFA